jgi:hypothetical protein
VEDIFGTNIGSLKGKTVNQPGNHVHGHINGMPTEIESHHQGVTLCIDIMFINKLLFFMTTLCKLYFGTAEYLANWQIDTASSALQKVIKLYTHCDFWIKAVHADPKFQALEACHPNLSFKFCAQNEHIPKIE